MHTYEHTHSHYHRFSEGDGELRRDFFNQAFDWLGGDPATIIDAGSGPGVASCLLAEHYPNAEVIAADGDADSIADAEARIARLGLTGRVRTLHTDLPQGIAELSADLIFSSKAVHHFGDQQGALDFFAGRLRPGGVLAIVEGWLPTRYLPRDIGIGRPGLQSRLDAALEERFSEVVGPIPFVDHWPGALRQAGLEYTGSRSFLYEHQAPLAQPHRNHVHAYLGHLREGLRDALSDEDNATWDVLLDGDNPASMLHRADLFVLGASTVHTARLSR